MSGVELRPQNTAHAFRTELAPVDQASGLADLDIGATARLNPASIRRVLAADGAEAAAMHSSAWRAQKLTGRSA